MDKRLAFYEFARRFRYYRSKYLSNVALDSKWLQKSPCVKPASSTRRGALSTATLQQQQSRSRFPWVCSLYKPKACSSDCYSDGLGITAQPEDFRERPVRRARTRPQRQKLGPSWPRVVTFTGLEPASRSRLESPPPRRRRKLGRGLRRRIRYAASPARSPGIGKDD
jgi:hypothetical protein